MAFTVPLLPNPDIKVEYNPDIQEDVLQYQEYFLLLEMPWLLRITKRCLTRCARRSSISHRGYSKNIALRIGMMWEISNNRAL